MQTQETVSTQNIQQAVIEKLALLSLDQQQEVLAFTERLAQPVGTGQSLWDRVQECIKDVPPEAWNDVPADGALNHDHYLYGSPKQYDETGALIEYEKQG